MAKYRIVPIQSTRVEKSIGVHVEIITEEPQEPDKVWTDFFRQGKRSLGNGGYRVSIDPQE